MGHRNRKNGRHVAKKRFGQHFLTDQRIIEKIIAAADIQPCDHIIEIGPGRGALTQPLVELGVDLTVVELDWDLAEGLRTLYADNSDVRIVEGDVLKTDWTGLIKYDKKNKIIANLPYNISSPVFFRITTHRHLLASAVLMVQKELALRIQHDGRGNTLKDYGILSVVAGNTFSVNTICQVPPGCFSPPPRVDSTVIRLVSKDIDLIEERAFFDFVKKAFNNRRKLFTSFLQREYEGLFNSLSSGELECLQGVRPENLLPDQYLKLFRGESFLD